MVDERPGCGTSKVRGAPRPVFSVPGRSRWLVPGLHRRPIVADFLALELIDAQPGTTVRANALTGRVLVISDGSIPLESIGTMIESAMMRAERAAAQGLSAGLVEASRGSQLAAIPGDNVSEEAAHAMRTANRGIALSVASLGAYLVGTAVSPALCTVGLAGFFINTIPVYASAIDSLRRGRVNIDTLTTIASVGGIAAGYHLVLIWGSVVLTVTRKLLLMISDRSHQELDVFKGQPPLVRVLVDGGMANLPVDHLEPGNIVEISAGETVPADGLIVDGGASLDQRILTGEAHPVDRVVGDRVLALSTVLSGRALVAVEAIGSETIAGRIGTIVNDATRYRADAQLRGEQLAERTVLPTFVAGIACIPFRGYGGGMAVLGSHFRRKVSTVMPLVVLQSMSSAGRAGILVKDGHVLDQLSKVDTVVFDKTGTLTDVEPGVGAVLRFSSQDEEEILRIAATIERGQSHPLARAILKEAERRSIDVPHLSVETSHLVGFGVSGACDGDLIHVGSMRFMEESGVQVMSSAYDRWSLSTERGRSVVMVAIAGDLVGMIELLPMVRAEAPRVVEALRLRPNVRSIVLLSGDQPGPTQAAADLLGADAYFAEVLPEDKGKVIQDMQKEGRKVCFVGDGVNDAIGLSKSDVSISLGGASSAAIDTAQIVLMDGSLRRLDLLFDLGDDFHRRTNTVFATIVAPSLVAAFGALFLRFDLRHSILIGEVALAGGLLSAIGPRFDQGVVTRVNLPAQARVPSEPRAMLAASSSPS